MSKAQRNLTIALWGLAVVAVMGAVALQLGLQDRQTARASVAATRPAQSDEPVVVLSANRGGLPQAYPAAAFSLVDQSGNPVSNDTLRGKPWIADFVFTRCSGTCPMMSGKMSKLQAKIPDASVKLVSFTCDPAYDTPEILKQYGEFYHASGGRWLFLTGDKDRMAAVAKGMLLPVIPATAADPIIHSQKFLLIDGGGYVRGLYDSENDDDVARLVDDANALAAGKPAGAPIVPGASVPPTVGAIP
jgi:cytochrome oxidase Cu insertion factor (SCO1/SenC/PrrC family)